LGEFATVAVEEQPALRTRKPPISEYNVELEAFIDTRPAAPTVASHGALPLLRVLVIASAQISEFTHSTSSL
jgi:hypothetical protein